MDFPGIWGRDQSTPSIPESAADVESMQDRNEPVNYRRMMDRNVDLNWSNIVDKIVYADDQQASVALQQKLKVAPTEQKVSIIDAIILQALPLMSAYSWPG